ncbi:HPr family phosphocarrier protein [Inediibacterium massiliense]|uniref:HPr family phosphocarrier protein n=1 Tax=Inediibacterium massiliense TaxID=1658111 RepID=UPI0006B5F611|nr:HPr family phosphocarrier protein [Inediibacterium massiliense]
MIKKEISIMHEQGLRARPAAMFVQLANKFMSDIFVEQQYKKVNAKSIMCIMALGLLKGESIAVSIDGPDEEEAIKAIEDFFQNPKENL